MNMRITDIRILTADDIQNMQTVYPLGELQIIFRNYPKHIFCVQTADGLRSLSWGATGVVLNEIPDDLAPAIIPVIQGYVDDINYVSDIRISNSSSSFRFYPIFINSNGLVTFIFFCCADYHVNSFSTNKKIDDNFINNIIFKIVNTVSENS